MTETPIDPAPDPGEDPGAVPDQPLEPSVTNPDAHGGALDDQAV